jgi:hypothetical protein
MQMKEVPVFPTDGRRQSRAVIGEGNWPIHRTPLRPLRETKRVSRKEEKPTWTGSFDLMLETPVRKLSKKHMDTH